ncbi:hypothetical protein QE152_g25262 [Popillia japonica]|uniref:Uncharacterized protein n=1 Tax=Popillia japonica TaxID=7064 RepID=A0AAW1K2J8_POPJA
MECWQSFTIADAILFIKGAMEELKSETIMACWKNLWNDIVLGSEDTHDINSQLTTIFNKEQKIDGEGFNDITKEELSDYINEEDQVFTNEKLEDFVKSSPEGDYINEEDQVFTNEKLEDFVKSSPEASNDEDGKVNKNRQYGRLKIFLRYFELPKH